MSVNEQQQQQQYENQLAVLQERFPNAPNEKLLRLLGRFHGDADQVRAILTKREFSSQKCDSLETRFGQLADTLQQEFPSTREVKRIRLLRIIDRFSGDADHVRRFLQKFEERHARRGERSSSSRHERREALKTQYATQLAELETAGINVHCPCIFRQLEKNQGDVNKVMEKMKNRRERKDQHAELLSKYGTQMAQLEADGVQLKNRRVLAHLLEKTQGDVNMTKQLIEERKEKHRQRQEYRKKHRSHSKHHEGDDPHEASAYCKKRRELSTDEKDKLKRLRSAGVHGNPQRILTIFQQCNESIEMTQAQIQAEREEKLRQRQERIQKRTLITQAQNSYINIDKQEDWPQNIEQVYLDGNNMMFVIDSLRRLCLNRAGKKTERAIGDIAAAWNDRVRIPHVDLIYDSTKQLDPIGTVTVSSAQPQYRTTDDMLVEIARRPENREKNQRTIIVTSDRALAVLLQNEGCQLMKPYSWFAHCVMTLTPDLIKYEEITGMTTTTSTPTSVKIRYDFDELVHRVASIGL